MIDSFSDVVAKFTVAKRPDSMWGDQRCQQLPRIARTARTHITNDPALQEKLNNDYGGRAQAAFRDSSCHQIPPQALSHSGRPRK